MSSCEQIIPALHLYGLELLLAVMFEDCHNSQEC